jgi:hypothetical protein
MCSLCLLQGKEFEIELDRPSGDVRHFRSQHLTPSKEEIEIE